MPRWYPLCGLLLAGGLALVLGELAWFRTRSLVDRLAPYAPSTPSRPRRAMLSAASLRDVVGPLATSAGNRLSSLFGVDDDLALRLRRSGSTLDPTEFRLRQCAYGLGALMLTGALAAAAQVPAVIALGSVLAAPVLAFLILEHHVSTRAEAYQTALTLELPVVAEQLGMLLSSGYSLGSAISRMARRSSGRTAVEFGEVARRIRQGVSELDALREWSDRAGVPAIERFVGVLALNWEASDLGSLISNEARTVRRDVQRTQIELIERRAQQVWIPVTVATLVPGVIFMCVPFLAAMRTLTGG